MTKAVFAFAIIALATLSVPTEAFIPFPSQCSRIRGTAPSAQQDQQRHNGRRPSPSPSTSVVSLRGKINFAGDSESNLFVPHPPTPSSGQPNPNRTLPHYLRSPESDPALLGTQTYSERPDGLWDCQQPTIDWFGLSLVPVFVNSIDRAEDSNCVTVDIVDARTDIAGGRPPGNRAKAIGGVMERSTFSGRYTLLWDEASGSRRGTGWTLSADLALVLTVPLPKLMPLPPGFNTVGSRIIRATCRSRVEQNLAGLRDGYLEWAALEDGDH